MVKRGSSLYSIDREIELLRKELTRVRQGMKSVNKMSSRLEEVLDELQYLRGMIENGTHSAEYLPPSQEPAKNALPTPRPNPSANPLGSLSGLLQNIDIGEVIKLLNNPMVQDLMKNFMKRS